MDPWLARIRALPGRCNAQEATEQAGNLRGLAPVLIYRPEPKNPNGAAISPDSSQTHTGSGPPRSGWM